MKTFIKTASTAERKALAKEAGVTDIYLFQIASGFRKPSAKLSKRLEVVSNGRLTRAELRPELFA